MSTLALFASLLLTSSASQAASSDPYAATAPGWSHCIEPNVPEKTCQSITTYQPLGNGRYDAHVIASLSQTNYVIEYDEQFSVIGGEVCSPVTWRNYSNLRYRRGERYLEGREAAEAEQAFRARYTGAGDVQLCASIAEEGNNLVATIKVMGEPSRGYRVFIRSVDVPLRWIHRDDGYTVRAWSPLRG